jgi:hypothetical protein
MKTSKFVQLLAKKPKWFAVECGKKADLHSGIFDDGSSYLWIDFNLRKDDLYKVMVKVRKRYNHKKYEGLVLKDGITMSSDEILDWLTREVMHEPYYGVSYSTNEES